MKGHMGWPSFPHRPHAWKLLDGQRSAVVEKRRKDRRPLLERQSVDLIEAASEEHLCRLVEVDRVAAIVDEEHRDCETAGELAGEDQFDLVLRHEVIVDAGSIGRGGDLLRSQQDRRDEPEDPERDEDDQRNSVPLGARHEARDDDAARDRHTERRSKVREMQRSF